MIIIKLKELLEEHDVNISELSEATSLARSTITPLVNKPEEVKGIKIETMNLICDYFGVTIGDLLEFVPEKTKYSIVRYWHIPAKENIHFVLLRKILGNADRFVLLFISTEQHIRSEEGPFNEYESRIFLMGKDEEDKIPPRLMKAIGNDKLLPKDIFLKDFKRQNSANQCALSKLIATLLITKEPMVDYTIERMNIYWEDFPLFERIKHDFKLINGNLILVDSLEDFKSEGSQIDLYLEDFYKE